MNLRQTSGRVRDLDSRGKKKNNFENRKIPDFLRERDRRHRTNM